MRLHLTSTDLPRRAVEHAAERAGRVLEAPVRGLRRASGTVLRLAGRHLGIVVAAATAALSGLLAWLLGSALEQWLVAEGMDDERAYLLSAMVLVLLATAIAGAASRRPGPTRLGGLAGFTGIQIIPFLVRAANQPATPGLRYTTDLLGWILQPLGMLLLGVICVIVGAALGVGLARDASRLPALLRRRWIWLAVPVAIALIVAATMAAMTALQVGPLSALRDYTVISTPPAAAVPSSPAGGSAAGPVASAAPTPDIGLLRQLPGYVEPLTVSGHAVEVYVPGIYGEDPSLALPVIYLLHGTPGDETNWLTGGQLQGVLDQLIADGTIPPMIAVLPNGNDPGTSDPEWGNTSHGAIETWLIQQLVPAIDFDYRTLGPGYRAIAGYSSGGFGAVNLAIRNPGVFSWAGSYSGYFVGPSSAFGSAWRANSPLYTASGVPASSRIPLYLGAGATDTTFRPDTIQFAATLSAIGWTDHDLQTVPGGHGWVAWQEELVDSLNWLGELWGTTPWVTPASTPAATPSPTPTGSPAPARAG
jgi:enterochelin esterase-like enzyme